MSSSLLSFLHQLLAQTKKQPITVGLASLILLVTFRRFRRPYRPSKLPRSLERVLVLGASSGIGKELALQYASKGARVCIVGRREEKLQQVLLLCREVSKTSSSQVGKPVLAFQADFTSPEAMIRVRDAIAKEWNGLDTILLCAGVSALQPILALAGVQAEINGPSVAFNPQNTTTQGIQNALGISRAAFKGNYEGPLVVALTFIPFISSTSSSPAILLMSSPAAMIPAPTRALYGASKSASLVLYQALSIENPSIAFTFVLPGTMQGDFRASAVDQGTVREADPNKHGLKPEHVARRCILAIDSGEKTVAFPFRMRLGHFLYWWISEGITEFFAQIKYNYPPRKQTYAQKYASSSL